jgi:hypothetical protein
MKIQHFEKTYSIERLFNTAACMRLNILLSDKFSSRSFIASEIIIYKDCEIAKDQLILDWMPVFYMQDENMMYNINFMEEALPRYNMVKKLKHKEPKQLVFMGQFKSRMSEMRNQFKETLASRVERLKLLEVAPFDDDREVLDLRFIDGNEDDKEDVFLAEISEILLESDSIFSFDPGIEKLFTFTKLYEDGNNNVDFIKIPLWKFPPLGDMTYAQMKHTRDNFKPLLTGFKKDLKELSGKLRNMTFSSENISEIKQTCHAALDKHIIPFQKAIDESIYISFLKNQVSEITGITFCLGIASVETLANYFMKSEILEPYMTDEIKQRISRLMDLKSVCVFSYSNMNIPEEMILKNQKPENPEV